MSGKGWICVDDEMPDRFGEHPIIDAAGNVTHAVLVGEEIGNRLYHRWLRPGVAEPVPPVRYWFRLPLRPDVPPPTASEVTMAAKAVTLMDEVRREARRAVKEHIGLFCQTLSAEYAKLRLEVEELGDKVDKASPDDALRGLDLLRKRVERIEGMLNI